MRQYSEQDPWWVKFPELSGFEDDPDGDEEDEEDEGNEEEEEEEEDSEESSKPKPKDNTGLKSALRKERLRANKAERDLKKLQKKVPTKEEVEDETARQKAEREAAEAQSNTSKLATRLRDQEVARLVAKAARAAGFADEDDAINLVKQSDLDIDQDEDDPSEIEVDFESVEEAIKALAKKKPHLLKAKDEEEEEDETPRTPKFNGRKKSKSALSEERLRELYPTLRN